METTITQIDRKPLHNSGFVKCHIQYIDITKQKINGK